ncbi:MAG: Mth938-like domain-containing protein [Burkholderiales bacterium]
MKFHLATAPGVNLFSGYGDGYVAVNGVRHETSLVLMPERIVAPWDVPAFEALGPAHFEFLRGLGAEVVLLGTGARQRFPPASLQRIILQAGTGLETMDAMAACRTYNILAAEGRKVAAAILLR